MRIVQYPNAIPVAMARDEQFTGLAGRETRTEDAHAYSGAACKAAAVNRTFSFWSRADLRLFI